MAITLDPAKSARNRELRGLPFDLVRRLTWSTILLGLSARQEITATRYVALGEIEDVLHVVVFVLEGHDCRVVSLRRAKAKERERWHAARTPI